MCDFSITQAVSRPAKVGERVTVKNFGSGTRGFTPADEPESGIAVCVLPGTEMAFDADVTLAAFMFPQVAKKHKLARFRQVNRDKPMMHHDALELPDGQILMLTLLEEGQVATVLQLPATPKTAEEAEAQKRLPAVG